MARSEDFKDVANEYMDHVRLAQTAESMGAHETAEAERQAASEVRQSFFGPDSQFKR
ncbi:hypothetical protein J7E95_39660 [Streptomyces sp. ISL-14]|nr:hypothetical protein [Streptomyces sp. ISL-14]